MKKIFITSWPGSMSCYLLLICLVGVFVSVFLLAAIKGHNFDIPRPCMGLPHARIQRGAGSPDPPLPVN